MAQTKAAQVTKYLLIVKNISIRSSAKCKQLIIMRIIPQSRKFAASGIKTYHEKLAPHLLKGSLRLGNELLKIHNKQNWFKRCGSTMLDNAAGLSMAMLSTKIVQNFVEVKEFGNLWGLLATRPVVSEQTYETLSFAVEFIIALTVFTLTEHFLEEFRQRNKKAEAPVD